MTDETVTDDKPKTEEELRELLRKVDRYDLSGEKAGAEALKKEEAFKQQAIEKKAEETKAFFREQDAKQMEALKELHQQATMQLQEQAQKEFWEQKQQQETQAGMEKELKSLHEAAAQAHQQFRAGFTQGICRDDVAAIYDKDIQTSADAYKTRLDDLGTNKVDAEAKIQKYTEQLQDDAAPKIEAQTAALHEQLFPEYKGVAIAKPGAPEVNPNPGFGPFEGAKPGDFVPGGEAPRGTFWPGEVGAPNANQPFFRNADATTAALEANTDAWTKPIDPSVSQQGLATLAALGSAADQRLGELQEVASQKLDAAGQAAKQFAAKAGEQFDAAAKAAGEKLEAMQKATAEKLEAVQKVAGEKLDAAREAIGEKMSAAKDAIAERVEQGAESARRAGEFGKEGIVKNPETYVAGAEALDHHMEVGAVPGLPHDVYDQITGHLENAIQHGPVGFNASVQVIGEDIESKWELFKSNLNDAKESAMDMKDKAVEFARDPSWSSTAEINKKAEASSAADETMDEATWKSGASTPENLQSRQNSVLREISNQDAAAAPPAPPPPTTPAPSPAPKLSV
jgi:hypothetical protein